MSRFTNLGASIEQAKEWLNDHIEEGAPCPLCHQLVKLYKRKLNSSMAYVLVLIKQWHDDQNLPVGKTEWLHVPSYIVSKTAGNPGCAAAVRGDWAKLKHWEMLEEQPTKRGDGSKRAGYYRITQRGIDFVNGTISVQAYIWLYNETRIDRPVTERVTIREAMGVRFNFNDLMSGR